MSRSRNTKPYWKPGKIFKQIRQRARRSADNQTVRLGLEPAQRKNNNIWDWN